MMKAGAALRLGGYYTLECLIYALTQAVFERYKIIF